MCRVSVSGAWPGARHTGMRSERPPAVTWTMSPSLSVRCVCQICSSLKLATADVQASVSWVSSCQSGPRTSAKSDWNAGAIQVGA